MSNWIDCRLDVLATNPNEISGVATALREPSTEYLLSVWTEDQRRLAELKRNLGWVDAYVNKARRFENSPKAAVAIETRHPDDAVIEGLRKLVAFQAVSNLGYSDESVNKARRFTNSFKSHSQGLINGHLCQVSRTFPNAIFLAEYSDMQWSCSWKDVRRNGVVERSVYDGYQPAQAIDWMLLDIFAPYRAEYERGLPFGSLWNQWVDDLVVAADRLRNRP